jgi:hypothetical protein
MVQFDLFVQSKDTGSGNTSSARLVENGTFRDATNVDLS